MKAYLVRLRDRAELRSHELVGVFVARDLDDLFWLIDQCVDPYACEYRRLSEGGFYMGGEAAVVPACPDDEDEPVDWLAGASLCGQWWSAFNVDEGCWRNFDRRSLLSFVQQEAAE